MIQEQPPGSVLVGDRGTLIAKQEVNKPCFVCGSERSEVRFLPDVRRWGETDFVLRRCCDCGLIFNSPRLPAERLEDLYRRNYYFFNRRADIEFERIRAAYLRTIAHLPLAAPGALLELGSAKGYMLALLSGLGWRVTGVEVADTAAQFSRRQFRVEVFTGTLEAFRRSDGRRFDVVLAQDVLEHIPEPEQFLRAAHDSLRPGGWLIVDTPNVGGANVEVVGERWRGFNPFHIYLFQRGTLTRALHQTGFTVRLIGSYNAVSAADAVIGATDRPARVPAAIRILRAALRRRLDRVLLPRYLHRAIEAVREGQAVPLDPRCRGDNLVCLAVRAPEQFSS
jgi:2-polyprenyl-3-methyl-5-hydroxy-6-metoxy-1,4-benzoquinol methylase